MIPVSISRVICHRESTIPVFKDIYSKVKVILLALELMYAKYLILQIKGKL